MFCWRWSVVFLVLLVQTRLAVKSDKINDDDSGEDNDDRHDADADNDSDDDNDDDDDEDEESNREKLERTSLTLRRTSASYDMSTDMSSTSNLQRTLGPLIARTTKKKPLECYVCVYKKDVALQACLDPFKHRVHTVVCPSLTDRCFTWIVSKEGRYEAVTRGCKAGCLPSPETICCEFSRCNNQALMLPDISAQALVQRSDPKAKNLAKTQIPPTVMYFITVLLLLQTVIKVPLI